MVDTTYLCHRARYSTGNLKHQDIPTGVAFGVLRDIESQVDLFSPDICVFAFDSGGPGNRFHIDERYKADRKKDWDSMSEEDQEEEKLFRQQMKDLYKFILPSMGFRNIFREKGFEGDDIIASVVDDLSANDEAVIYTGDNDLWQCLGENVVWRSPNGKVVTFQSFRDEWGILPVQWPDVKAIAGCASDNVIGVKGVGEKTAIKWLKGRLKQDSVKFKTIEEFLGQGQMTRNLRLVKLPFEGTPQFTLRDDECSEERKRKTYDRLGIKKRGTPPSKVKGFDL